MPNMKYLSLTVQKLWPRFKFFFGTESGRQSQRQTDWTRTRCPEFRSGGIQIIFELNEVTVININGDDLRIC